MPYLSELTRAQWEQYLIESRQQIRQQFQEGSFPPTNQLHEVRKQLKELYYNELIIPEPLTSRVEPREAMDALQNALGNWHDREVTLEQIRRVGNHCGLPQRQARRLNRIQKALRKEMKQWKDRICQQAIQLYGQPDSLPASSFILISALAFGLTWNVQQHAGKRAQSEPDTP